MREREMGRKSEDRMEVVGKGGDQRERAKPQMLG